METSEEYRYDITRHGSPLLKVSRLLTNRLLPCLILSTCDAPVPSFFFDFCFLIERTSIPVMDYFSYLCRWQVGFHCCLSRIYIEFLPLLHMYVTSLSITMIIVLRDCSWLIIVAQKTHLYIRITRTHITLWHNTRAVCSAIWMYILTW